jgi:hypothetical protein
MKYHFLLAYLPELSRDQTQLRFTWGDLIEEKFHIDPGDWRDLEMVLLRGDVFILSRLLAGKQPPAVYALHDNAFWLEQIKSPEEGPSFLQDFLQGLEMGSFGPREEDQLYEAYFSHVSRNTQSSILAGYIQLEMNLRNVLAAARARRKGLEVAGGLAGDNEVVEALATSPAEDFGLAKDLPWVEKLATTLDPLEIEEIQEKVLWDYLDEAMGSNPFSFSHLMAYALKLQRLEHRFSRSEERGLALLRRLEAH